MGIAWKWQALDGVITKAPLGGDDTGPSPVDRSKRGTKRSVLTDQRGAPLAVEVTGTHTHDKTVALATLDGLVVERPEKVVYRLHHLCRIKAMTMTMSSKELRNATIIYTWRKVKPTKPRYPPQRNIRLVAGSSNEPTLGIIGSADCWSDGRKRVPITKHSFT